MHRILAVLVTSLSVAAQDPRPFGEILPTTRCEHEFVAERDGLQGVALPIATYGRTNTCTLIAELFDGDNPIARAEWRADRLVDNGEIELPCPVQAQSRGRAFRLVLRAPDAAPGNAVTAWSGPAGGLHVRASFAGDTLMLGEILANRRFVQTIVASDDGLCALQLACTDFGRRNGGQVQLSVRDPISGRELASRTIDAATIGNEDWRGLEFTPVTDSRGRTFALELTSSDGRTGRAATAYLERGASYRGELSCDGAPRLGRLMLTATYAAPGPATGTGIAAALGGGTIVALLLGWFARRRDRHRRARGWFAWAAASATALIVGTSYVHDVAWVFWPAGAACCVSLLVVATTLERRRLALQCAMVPALLFAALLVAQPFGGATSVAAAGAPSADAPATVDLRQAPWSFAASRGEPAAFRRWWQRLTGEWNSPDRGCSLVQRSDPLGELPFVLQPDATTRFFDSTIRVNNLGFRGNDIARDKGAAFRIVCLGESTTMGQTLFAEDRPWPEVLQALLATPERARRIEVINAGWASYDIRHSAIRLRRFVLDLQPDLVIVYHGYNGFWMLLPDVATALVAGSRLPQRVHRPSWLLANAEYGLQVAAFRGAMQDPSGSARPTADVGACAAAYRDLIAQCAARGIAVALCSFNMAVRADSPLEVIEFYRAGFPQVERQIAANTLQTTMLSGLADASRGVTFIDTSTDLDGAFGDAFVDLVHFTQAGRDRMARNVAAGIRALLPE